MPNQQYAAVEIAKGPPMWGPVVTHRIHDYDGHVVATTINAGMADRIVAALNGTALTDAEISRRAADAAHVACGTDIDDRSRVSYDQWHRARQAAEHALRELVRPTDPLLLRARSWGAFGFWRLAGVRRMFHTPRGPRWQRVP